MRSVYINDNGKLLDITDYFGGLTSSEVDDRIMDKLTDYPDSTIVGSMIDNKIAEALSNFGSGDPVTGELTLAQVDARISTAISPLASKESLNSYALKSDLDGLATSDDIDAAIADKIYRATLDSELANYAKAETLSGYLTSGALDEYIKASEVEAKLEDYATNEALNSATSGFITADFLKDYAKTADVKETISDYATKASVSQDIEDYDKQVDGKLENYYTKSEIGTATSEFRTESQISEMINNATAEFVASDDIDSRIAEATKDYITEDALASYETTESVNRKIAAVQVAGGKPVVTGEQFSIYVNSGTGSDDNDGLSEDKAFATLDRAMVEAVKYSFGYCKCIVYISGEFTPTLQAIPKIDSVVPMTITGTGMPYVVGVNTINLGHEAALHLASGAMVQIENVSFVISGTTAGSRLSVNDGASLTLEGVSFAGTANNATVLDANFGSRIVIGFGVTFNCNAYCAIESSDQSTIAVVEDIDIIGGYRGPIVRAINNAELLFEASVSGNATGKKYYVGPNSLIYTNGGGPNFLPGDVDGEVSTYSGHYV